MKITNKQISELKDQYGDIFEITCGEYVGYFKIPTLETYKIFYELYNQSVESKLFLDEDGNKQIKKVKKTDIELKADAILAQECFVIGDEEMIDFDKHPNLILSYRDKLLMVLDIKNSKIETFKKDGYIEIECNGKKAKFGTPKFNDLLKIVGLYGSDDSFYADIILCEKSFIEGDIELSKPSEYPNYFVSIRKHLATLIEPVSSEIKKK